MNRDERIELYKLVIDANGKSAQKGIVIEECAELINAILKHKRGRIAKKEVVEEVADVMIVLEQLLLMLGVDNVDEYIDKKLTRLDERLANGSIGG